MHLCDGECQRLAETGSAVAFCPTSNLFLGSGLFDLAKLEKYKVKVGLGTDVGAGTSFSQLQSLNEAYKVMQLQGTRLDPFKSLYLATLGGARALELDDRVGSFAQGNEADFVVLDYKATPLLGYRLQQAKTLEEKLFALVILGDDRTVKETFAARPQRASPRLTPYGFGAGSSLRTNPAPGPLFFVFRTPLSHRGAALPGQRRSGLYPRLACRALRWAGLHGPEPTGTLLPHLDQDRTRRPLDHPLPHRWIEQALDAPQVTMADHNQVALQPLRLAQDRPRRITGHHRSRRHARLQLHHGIIHQRLGLVLLLLRRRVLQRILARHGESAVHGAYHMHHRITAPRQLGGAGNDPRRLRRAVDGQKNPLEHAFLLHETKSAAILRARARTVKARKT